jgi:hypothetical protein
MFLPIKSMTSPQIDLLNDTTTLNKGASAGWIEEDERGSVTNRKPSRFC